MCFIALLICTYIHMKATVCILYSLLFEQGDKMWYPYLLHDPAFHWDSTLGCFVWCQHYCLLGTISILCRHIFKLLWPTQRRINYNTWHQQKQPFSDPTLWTTDVRYEWSLVCMSTVVVCIIMEWKYFWKIILCTSIFEMYLRFFSSFMQYKYWIRIFHEKFVITQE